MHDANYTKWGRFWGVNLSVGFVFTNLFIAPVH